MDRTPTMSASWRARLWVALVILSLLALAFLVYAGQNTHAWFETQDSLSHWREKQQATPAGQTHSGFDSPGQRIARLEADAEKTIERLLLSVGMLLFNGALIFLGARKLRTG